MCPAYNNNNNSLSKWFALELQPQLLYHRIFISQCKNQRDKEARAHGLPKSGVLQYGTFQTHLREWFRISSVFRHLEPALDGATIVAKMEGCIKSCTSAEKVNDVVYDLVRKRVKNFQAQKYAAVRMKRKAEEIEKEAKAAKIQVTSAEKEKAQLIAKKQGLKTKKFKGNRATAARKLKHETKIIDDKLKEAEEKKKIAAELEAKKQTEIKLLKAKAASIVVPTSSAAMKIPDGPPKKPKRRDYTVLDETRTPREKVLKLGQAWNPPRLDTENSKGNFSLFAPPGDSFKEESIKKIELLSRLRKVLHSDGVLEAPMTFCGLMEHLCIDEICDCNFDAKVFLYLMALILHESW